MKKVAIFSNTPKIIPNIINDSMFLNKCEKLKLDKLKRTEREYIKMNLMRFRMDIIYFLNISQNLKTLIKFLSP